MLRRDVQQPVTGHGLSELTEQAVTFLDEPTQPGMTVFNVRLTLTILDVINAQTGMARKLVNSLHRNVTDSRDGYAARECLAHNLFTTLAASTDDDALKDFVHLCALEARTIPVELNTALFDALRLSRAAFPEPASSST